MIFVWELYLTPDLFSAVMKYCDITQKMFPAVNVKALRGHETPWEVFVNIWGKNKEWTKLVKFILQFVHLAFVIVLFCENWCDEWSNVIQEWFIFALLFWTCCLKASSLCMIANALLILKFNCKISYTEMIDWCMWLWRRLPLMSQLFLSSIHYSYTYVFDRASLLHLL
jgi:hypothetical protein